MIKINILKNGQVTNSATFDSQELADAWLAREEANRSFGQLERWVRDDQDVSSAIDTREISPEGEEPYTEYLLPKEYEVEVVDVTAQVAQEQAIEEARQYLASTDWMIIREMDSGVLCPQEIKDLRELARQTISGD